MLEFTGTNCSAVPPIILSGERGGKKVKCPGTKMNYLNVVFYVFICFMKTVLCILVSTAPVPGGMSDLKVVLVCAL